MRRLAVLASLPLALLGCSSNDDSGTSPPATSATGTREVSLTKCTYDIAPRMEYTDVYFPKTRADTAAEKVGPAPDIKRLRLGLGGRVKPGDAARADPTTSIAVAWETTADTNATTIQWGTTPDPKTWAATDRVDGLSYTVEAAKGSGGQPQRLHEVHVCGLTPDTTYYYRVGGGSEAPSAWSDVLSFRTLPASPDTAITIAVTGDSRGENANAWQILQERLAKRGDVGLQLFTGDMVDLAVAQGQYESWLSNGERDTKGARSMFGRVLSLIAMGNHENYSSQFFASVVQPDDRKSYPDQAELFFSIDVGAAHIIVFDDFAIGSPTARPGYADVALAWLTEDLEAASKARAQRPWIIAVHHHGEWTSSSHKDDKDVLGARAALVPLWDKYGVDLVLDGHDHNYERSKPLTLGKDGMPVLGKGTTYVVCAGSGADGYGNGTSAWTHTSFSYSKDGAIGAYGVLRVEKTKLSFEAHALTMAGDDPTRDTFEITK